MSQFLLILVKKVDEVYVHDIFRLARNIEDLHRLVCEINEKGAPSTLLRKTSTSAVTNNPTQITLKYAWSGLLERSIMLERQWKASPSLNKRGSTRSPIEDRQP